MTTDTSPAILTDPFPEAQVAITARLDEILDACRVKDFERLAAFHLTGPKFSKFDDVEPLDRQDDEIGMQSEMEQFSAIDDLDARLDDLKIDVFGAVAVVTGVFRASYQVQGAPEESRTRSTVVLVDAGDGNWLICHEHHSPVALHA